MNQTKINTTERQNKKELSRQSMQVPRPEDGQATTQLATLQRAQVNPTTLQLSDLLTLQRTVGNRQVQRIMTQMRPSTPIANSSHRKGSINSTAGYIQRVEVGNQFYAHGGFMAAARQMLNDSTWNRILQTLMPDVYADAQDVTDEDDLISMFENNPVMAAYGMLQTQQLDQRREGGRSDRIQNMQAFEWDVFLNPDTVRAYSVAFNATTERALDERLVDTMIIAHGTTWQTIQENRLGISQYSAVRGTRKTNFGGTRPGTWMDIFGRAIQIATASNPNQRMAAMSRKARHTNEDDQSLYQTFQRQMSFRNVIDLYRRIFGRETFSVLLDVKSRNAQPWVLRRLIGEFNRRGVHVYGVGTFIASELENLNQVNQRVNGQDMGAPRGIKFFHGIGNLQAECTAGRVFAGDTVMFNAGSILESVDWDANSPDATDTAIETIIRQLGAFKNTYRFHLGLYIQEGSASFTFKRWAGADQRAVRKITEFSNRHSDIFDLGFAWGGISNEMGPVRSGNTGIGSQSSVSENWDEDVRPGTAPRRTSQR